MADTSAKEYAAQIATQLHTHIKFLRGRWQEFCEMVERNAEQLANYQDKHIGQKARIIEKYRHSFFSDPEQYKRAKDAGDKKMARQLEKVAERNKAECNQMLNRIQLRMDKRKKKAQNQGWVIWGQSYDTVYLKLNWSCLAGHFYAPRDVVNPLLWILDKEGNRREPTPEESLLCDYTIMCYVHDHNISGSELRIYSPRTYKCKYFACDEFYYLNRHGWPKDRLQRAFDAVKAKLDELQEQNKPQEKDGQMQQTSNGVKAYLPNEKTAETWYWKLYEKTIKAAFDAILDKLNPS